MGVKFELDYEAIKRLEMKMAKLPDRMERATNDVLHTDGIRIATEEITKLIPVSTRKGKIRNKKHARHSNWSKSEKINLGFVIKARGGAANKKGSFGYLVFPNEGRGAHNPVEQRFMERGLEAATPRILAKLHEKIDQILEEES
ncbi:putative tail component [Geobacillus phage vB_GthS_PK5.2]|nr:putative tail component [Geobacillus phage vB_GthS_PK5.2]